MAQYLHQIPFRIYLSFDLWSSPNHRSFLGVVAHWATLEGILKSATIGFCRFQGPHSGSNIAEVLWQILERFEQEKLDILQLTMQLIMIQQLLN